MNKKTLFLAIALFITVSGFSQSYNFNPEVGISLKGSTNGFGGDIYYRPMPKFAIKAGAEYVNINIKSSTLESYLNEDLNVIVPMPYGSDITFNTSAKYKTGALSLSLGYQPFRLLYFTAGIGKFLFGSEATGTPMTDLIFESQNIPSLGTVTPSISKENLGNFNITVNTTKSITPYVGIGLGSFVPQNKNISFALEIGVYYVGNYVVKAYMPPGLKFENIDMSSSINQEQIDRYFGGVKNEIDVVLTDLNREVDNIITDINENVESYHFYPVLKLTVGIRAFKFRK